MRKFLKKEELFQNNVLGSRFGSLGHRLNQPHRSRRY